MNRKGFTLAEMLAVIVFIAIVAIITAPIVLDLIEESKQNAAIDNAYGYVDAIQKYYETKSYDEGNVIVLDGQYDVVNGILNGFEADNLDVPVTGSVPINGKLIYEEDKLVSGCLTFNDYRVGYASDKFDIYGKGSCRINGDFEHDSWETIATNYSIDNNAYDNEIGKTRTISFNYSNTNYTVSVMLLNTSTPSECRLSDFSQTACGLVVGFENVISSHNITDIWPVSGGWWNTTNEGGWNVSALRRDLNSSVDNDNNPNNMYYGFPADLKAVIIPTAPIVSGSGSSGISNNVVDSRNSLGDYLYIPSAYEVGFDDQRDDRKFQTRTLDYYVLHNDNAHRIKRYGNDAVAWWLRTANHNSGDQYLIIRNDGSLGSMAPDGFNQYAYAATTFRIGLK